MDSAIGSAAVCSAVVILVIGSALLRSVVGLALGLCSRHWNYRIPKFTKPEVVFHRIIK
jgi:hypothetical protein